MRFLLASTALAALVAGPAAAETVISTAVTTPVKTSTANDDLRISSAGSVKVTSGAAVTIDSNDSVKNEGTIAFQGANNSTGILANPNLTGNITNTGAITIDENYTATDADSDGDLDGPFAQGSNRFGIHVLGGGTFTGNVANSGAITVEGNQSAGIAIDSPLIGSLNDTGKISVIGDDSFGIRTSDVSAGITIGAGSVTSVVGKNSIGVLVGGNVGGGVVIGGSISSTGYRNTTPPADTSKLDADDLLQGGSALEVAGNVNTGIVLDTGSSVTTTGSTPAVRIGSATQDLTIGAAGSVFGLNLKGAVAGVGAYSGVSATGVALGGLGKAVNLAGGIVVTGAVQAKAVNADAVGLNVGAGTTAPQIVVAGAVVATGAGTDATSAQALVIDAGATVNSLTNSGTIAAGRSGTAGTASAIVDKSGTLALITNSGTIGVTDAATLGDKATAIDLSANTTGAVVRQIAAATGKPAPLMFGNILFGSGNDTLDIQAGTVSGKVDFGGGSDILSLTGGGAFHGTLANSAGVAATVGTGSVLDVRNPGTVDLASLTTAADASLGVRIADAGHTMYQVAGAASFGTGTKILVSLDHVGTAAGTYTIVDAGTLTGAENLSSSVVTLPFLFNSSLTSNAATGQVALKVEIKGSGELGVNAAEATILDAVLDVADKDTGIAAAFLQAADSGSIKNTLQQLLPDFAGGSFEAATKGSRLTAQTLSDPRRVSGLWLQEVTWGSRKKIGQSSGYDVSGWGFSGGYGASLGPIGTVGVTAAYMFGKDSRLNNELADNHYEAGVYWRGGTGPFTAWARGTAATINFDSVRNFDATLTAGTVSRRAHAKWNGRLYSASGGVAYEMRTGRLDIRPNASVEYYKLTEGAYTETGGGEAFDLTVRERTSNETAANAMLAIGYELLGSNPDEAWARFEIEGGRREILSGALGKTVASYGANNPFTLVPEQRESGWRGAVRFLAGGSALSLVAEASAEKVQGDMSLAGRLGVGMAF
ncbi:MAG: autotransporter domain-containing protein [Pseudomonadota bacterium]